jgi:hypothetical protein
MTQEPPKSNIVLIIIAVIGVIGTIIGATITVIGNYNVEKMRQELELTRIALVATATQDVATQESMVITTSIPINTPFPIYTPTTIPMATPTFTIQPIYTKPPSTLNHEQRLQLFLTDLNARYPNDNLYLIKYDDSDGSFWIGTKNFGTDLQPMVLPVESIAGNYQFHYWDGQGGGDVGYPSQTVDTYNSDPQTGWIGKIWFL